MDDADIEKFGRAIRDMCETVSEFAGEFADLSDPELCTLIESQKEIFDAANWKIEAAQTELRLRKLKSHVAKAGRA